MKTFTDLINDGIFVLLINEYIKFILEKTKLKNSKFLKFIIIRGCYTVTNVFNNILYYTKNLDLTFYHCQKAYYYYIEFIEQITDEKNTFLQLTSRDAITYVYKKTIYEINNDVRKNVVVINKDQNYKFNMITTNIKKFNKIV